MKKIAAFWLILICFFAFTGCKEEEYGFSIEDSKKELYNEKINEALKREHWNYDDGGIAYESSKVPDEKTNGFEEVKRACAKEGFNIGEYKGKEAVMATVRLFYFNNDEAGSANFYFIDDEIVCGYYLAQNKIYSISETNVFSDDAFSRKTENISKQGSFDEIAAKEKFDGYEDGYWNGEDSVAASISDNKVKFYKFKNNDFYLDREMDFSGEGLFPMDASFNGDGNFAVLLGRKKNMGKETVYSEEDIQEMKKNGLTDDEINGAVILLSDSIAFFDKNYNKSFERCGLEVSSYGSIAYIGGEIFAARGRGVDIFSNQNGRFSKTKQYLLKQWAEKIKAADIDNDGIVEFITTDNINLFIYHLEETPTLLWRTHLSLESMETRFYIGDQNGDGVNEIYISDSYLDTSVKYVLTDYGFKAFSAEYGEKYIPGDFNGDGKADYITVGNDENDYKIFIGK